MKDYVSVHHHVICTGLKIYYPNVLLNQYDVPFCLKCMNGIQGTKPSRQQSNQLSDAVFTILKY